MAINEGTHGNIMHGIIISMVDGWVKEQAGYPATVFWIIEVNC